jgi:hypothetical protein
MLPLAVTLLPCDSTFASSVDPPQVTSTTLSKLIANDEA